MTTTIRRTVTYELPVGSDVDQAAVLRAIADDHDDDSGTVEVDGFRVRWDSHDLADGVELDRRQRLAAALLIMGFDLPQEMAKAARTMMEAARVCPGLHTGDIGTMGGQTRRSALSRAQGIIGEMLAEMDGVDPAQ